MAEERVLVATAPAGKRRLQKVLAGHELVFVDTLDEARAVLERQRFCCLILGMQFDESRMLRLLDHLRSHRHLPAPVVCVIGIKGRLSEAAMGAFEQAAKALQVSEVLDMADFADDARGNERLHAALQRFL
jgi:DNA-binding NtrC family response regulator